jgi:chromosome partitioning protein
MFIISVVNPKGGAGKSSLAVGMAVAAFLAGKVSVLIDLDPQASAAKWKDRRGAAEPPAVVSAQASRLKPTLDAAEQGGAEIVIIDTAGRNDTSALEAARASDLVLIPTATDILELEVLPQAADIVRLAGSPPAFVVLNKMNPSAGRQVIEARELIRSMFKLECAPIFLTLRNAYKDAMTNGRTPQELDAEGKAAAELAALFQFSFELVNKGTGEHEQDSQSTSAA